MNSFFFWLATAGGLGVIAGTMLRPGFPEVVLVWAAVVGLYYGIRAIASRRPSAQA